MDCTNCEQSRAIERLKEEFKERISKIEKAQDLLELDVTNLKIDQREIFTKMTDLIKKMDDFITTIKWCLGGLATIATISVSIIALITR